MNALYFENDEEAATSRQELEFENKEKKKRS
jgi:hypothetical protein